MLTYVKICKFRVFSKPAGTVLLISFISLKILNSAIHLPLRGFLSKYVYEHMCMCAYIYMHVNMYLSTYTSVYICVF